jgi:hypothetical protein
MKLDATHVSVDDFVDQYFQISFHTEDPDADLDLSAPSKPYLLIQRQLKDDDAGVCYIEAHDPDMPDTSVSTWSNSLRRGLSSTLTERLSQIRSYLHARSTAVSRDRGYRSYHFRCEPVSARVSA